MKQFKGTPGPWHVSNEGCMLIRDDNGLSIVAKYVGYTNDDEEVANEHLIAAAPELLEALQNCAYWLEVHSEPFSIEHDHVQSTKAAINKAIGGE